MASPARESSCRTTLTQAVPVASLTPMPARGMDQLQYSQAASVSDTEQLLFHQQEALLQTVGGGLSTSSSAADQMVLSTNQTPQYRSSPHEGTSSIFPQVFASSSAQNAQLMQLGQKIQTGQNQLLAPSQQLQLNQLLHQQQLYQLSQQQQQGQLQGQLGQQSLLSQQQNAQQQQKISQHQQLGQQHIGQQPSQQHQGQQYQPGLQHPGQQQQLLQQHNLVQYSPIQTQQILQQHQQIQQMQQQIALMIQMQNAATAQAALTVQPTMNVSCGSVSTEMSCPSYATVTSQLSSWPQSPAQTPLNSWTFPVQSAQSAWVQPSVQSSVAPCTPGTPLTGCLALKASAGSASMSTQTSRGVAKTFPNSQQQKNTIPQVRPWNVTQQQQLQLTTSLQQQQPLLASLQGNLQASIAGAMPNIGMIPAGLIQTSGRLPTSSSLPIGLLPGGQSSLTMGLFPPGVQGSVLANPRQMTSFRNSVPFTQESLQRAIAQLQQQHQQQATLNNSSLFQSGGSQAISVGAPQGLTSPISALSCPVNINADLATVAMNYNHLFGVSSDNLQTTGDGSLSGAPSVCGVNPSYPFHQPLASAHSSYPDTQDRSLIYGVEFPSVDVEARGDVVEQRGQFGSPSGVVEEYRTIHPAPLGGDGNTQADHTVLGFVGTPQRELIQRIGGGNDVVVSAGSDSSAPVGLTAVVGAGKQTAKVKPQILTHVIEGFVIQEGPEPFPVQRSSFACSSLDSSEDYSDGSNEGPANESSRDERHRDKRGGGAVQEEDVTIKCAYCGTLIYVPKVGRVNRYCSTQCAKRCAASTRWIAQKVSHGAKSTSRKQASTDGKGGQIGSKTTAPTQKTPQVRTSAAASSRSPSKTHSSVSPKSYQVTTGTVQSPVYHDNNSLSHDNNSLSSGEERSDSPVRTVRPSYTASLPSGGSAERDKFSGTTESVSEDIQLPTSLTRKHPSQWGVMDVYCFVKALPGCRIYADEFKSQEIDGQALLLLKEDHLMTTLNVKLGPALKICSQISALKDSFN